MKFGLKGSPAATAYLFVTIAFEVAGIASKTTAGCWLANSDHRIKIGIRDIPNAQLTGLRLSFHGH